MKTLLLNLIAVAGLAQSQPLQFATTKPAIEPQIVITSLNKDGLCEVSGGYICPMLDAISILVTWDEIADADGVILRGEYTDAHGDKHAISGECAKYAGTPTTAVIWILRPGIRPEQVTSLTVATYRKQREVKLR